MSIEDPEGAAGYIHVAWEKGALERTTPLAYSLAVRFVETPVFTTALKGLMVDEPYRRLQGALMLRPEQGPVVPGSAGLRELRWGPVQGSDNAAGSG